MTRRRLRSRHTARTQRGSALLLAMVIMTLVVTLAAGMIWQQTRAIQVETAERARSQSSWILNGALDWAGLVLAEDARDTPSVDHLGEVWAVPLAEARLKTFLAADSSGVADADATQDGPDAFLSGSIIDAQSRWNLRNLINAEGKVDVKQLDVLQRLCDSAGVPGDTAQRVADGFLAATQGGSAAPVMPATMRDLVWLGLDRAVVAQLESRLVLLPAATKLNLNTASAEVIAAVVPDASLGLAQGLVEARKRAPFRDRKSLEGLLNTEQLKVFGTQLDVKTSYFEIRGRMRLDDRVLEEASIVQRNTAQPGRSGTVVPIHRERVNYVELAR